MHKTVLQIIFFSISIVLVKFEVKQYWTKVGLWNQYPLCWRPDSDIIIIYIMSAISKQNSQFYAYIS